jgi:hypothetical protein
MSAAEIADLLLKSNGALHVIGYIIHKLVQIVDNTSYYALHTTILMTANVCMQHALLRALAYDVVPPEMRTYGRSTCALSSNKQHMHIQCTCCY